MNLTEAARVAGVCGTTHSERAFLCGISDNCRVVFLPVERVLLISFFFSSFEGRIERC